MRLVRPTTLKTVGLVAGLAALAGIVGYVAFGVTGVLVGVVLSWVVAAAAAQLSPRLVMRVRGAAPLAPSRAPELYRMVQILAMRAGIPAPSLYVLRSREANALTVGSSARTSAIAISEGALQLLDHDELEGVLAHEIAHLRNGDTVLLRLVGSAAQAALWVLWASIWIALFAVVFFGADVTRALLLSLLALVVPAGIGVLRASLSRTRELAADDTAVELTGNPTALASALVKFAIYHRPWHQVLFHRERHVVDPLSTHPTTAERVRRLTAATA
jgi:heat shock protein HtpX